MKININLLSALVFLLGVNFQTTVVMAQLKVVTTLSTYADIAKTVAGDLIEVSAVASPRFNPHFIEPRPSDVLKLKRAHLFIHSGLDLEAWRGPLLDAAAKSDFREGGSRQLDLSRGITLIGVPAGQVSRSQGDIHLFGNPHFWNNPQNGLVIAQQIAAKLSELDPANAAVYASNTQEFSARLKGKMAEWRNLLAPYHSQQVIGYHDEWPYMMAFAGLEMSRFVEAKPGIPPGPQQLEALEAFIRKYNVKVLIQASYFSKEAGIFLNQRTGIRVLDICQNVGELPQCSDYITMLEDGFKKIADGLAS